MACLCKKEEEMKKEYRSHNDAREFVQKLKLKGQVEWSQYSKSGNKPKDIPSNPPRSYKNKGWISWADFLGHKNRRKNDFKNYVDAKKFVQSLNLKSVSEFRKYCNSEMKPDNIPSNPQQVFEKQWTTWGDWLGTYRISDNLKIYLSFDEAKKCVNKLNFSSWNEWKEFCKSGDKPKNIPMDARQTYTGKGWTDWNDFLGTGKISTKKIHQNFLTFDEARLEVRKLAKKYNLKNWEDWLKAKQEGKIPNNIPANPNKVYKKRK